jgi:hypothetical protein
MTKQKITISLDSEIAEKLRLQSIEKYGNSRSMSRLIEDLATGAAEAEQPETCSILGHRTASSFEYESDFNRWVKIISGKLPDVDILQKADSDFLSVEDIYFALKEACELEINRYADMVNKCWTCANLSGPVPKYPTAGKNFELYAMMQKNMR